MTREKVENIVLGNMKKFQNGSSRTHNDTTTNLVNRKWKQKKSPQPYNPDYIWGLKPPSDEKNKESEKEKGCQRPMFHAIKSLHEILEEDLKEETWKDILGTIKSSPLTAFDVPPENKNLEKYTIPEMEISFRKSKNGVSVKFTKTFSKKIFYKDEESGDVLQRWDKRDQVIHKQTFPFQGFKKEFIKTVDRLLSSLGYSIEKPEKTTWESI